MEKALDVSFMTKYLNKITTIPVELYILQVYNLNSKGEDNTFNLFLNKCLKKFNVTTEKELYVSIDARKLTSTYIKIKHGIDSLVYKEFGCEVSIVKSLGITNASASSIVIKLDVI